MWGKSVVAKFEALLQLFMKGLMKTMKWFGTATLWAQTWTLKL